MPVERVDCYPITMLWFGTHLECSFLMQLLHLLLQAGLAAPNRGLEIPGLLNHPVLPATLVAASAVRHEVEHEAD